MAVDSVRRLVDRGVSQPLPTQHISKFERLNSRELDAVDLLSDESPYFDSYEFDGQTRTYSEFEFTTEPLFGSPKSAIGVLEYREESNFIFLVLDQDTPKPDTIFDELRENAGDQFPVQGDFSPTYENICDFIRAADHVVKVNTPTTKDDPVTRISEGANLPIELARLRFDYEENSKIITYSDGQLTIPLPERENSLLQSLSEQASLREYVIQTFEMAFHE